MPVVLTSLQPLVEVLRGEGYRVIGPTARDGALVLAELESAAELPYGTGVSLAPGAYRLADRTDGAAFAHVAGPQSWKSYLHPARQLLWSGHRDGDGFATDGDGPGGGPAAPEPRYAFLGVRGCDLAAIGVQDHVLARPGNGYATRRGQAFIVAVNCTVPGETCFCASMGTGPKAGPGYDIVLTELADGASVHYVAEAGTEAGERVLGTLPQQEATGAIVARAEAEVRAAAGRMGRALPEVDVRALLADSLEAEHWNEVATRCMSCGNCTMVCPTCFCTTVSDTTDLTGTGAQRWQKWDSCFDLDYSYIHGGAIRPTIRGRYRQWLTHKLSTWHDQFGESGCVGCGRCIVWCPVGIDLTAEVAALAAEKAATEPALVGAGGVASGATGAGKGGR